MSPSSNRQLLQRALRPQRTTAMSEQPFVLALRDEHSPEAIRSRRGPDLRLVPVACAVWACVATTVLLRQPWALVMCAVALPVAVLLLRGGVRRSAVVSLLCAALAGAVAWGRVLLLDATSTLTALRAGRSSVISGEHVVAGTPKQLSEGRVLLFVEVPELGAVPVFISGERAQPVGEDALDVMDLQPGQKVELSATLRLTDEGSMVPVNATATRAVELAADPDPQGIWMFTHWLRAGLRYAVGPLGDGVAGLIPGMVMGDVSGQSPQARQEFLITGLSHLTAVSGANVAIVTGTTMVLLTALGLPRRWTISGAALSLVGFVAVVGPEPSVLRAAVMGAVGVVAVASSRWSDVLAALSSAVILLLLVDPGLSVEYAFVLSVVATAGIVALAPTLATSVLRWWSDYGHERWRRAPTAAEAMLVRLVCVSFAADVVTAPVIVHMTGRVSLTALVANLLVTWAVAPVTVLGLAAAPFGALASAINVPAVVPAAIVLPAAPCAGWILFVAHQLSAVPMLRTPGGTAWALVWVAVVATGILSVYRHRQWRTLRWVWLLLAVILGTGVEVQAGGVGEGERGWDAPHRIDATGLRVAVVSDDEEAERVAHATGPPPQLIVVDSCGRSHGRPSVTREGIAVVYPCRDGTQVRGGNVE